MNLRFVPKNCGSVELTKNGLRFQRTRPTVTPRRGGGVRGKIVGFSLASARRLRERFFRCDFAPPDMLCYGVCLTLPREADAVIGESVWKQLHKHRDKIPALVAAVWRKELQKNRRVHFHLVTWSSETNSLRTAGALVRTWCRLVSRRCPNPSAVEWKMLLSHCRGHVDYFDSEPAADLPPGAPEREERFVRLMGYLPCVTPVDANGRGVQYLIDHGSRFKEYQAKTAGRAWGIWNRKKLPILPPGTSQKAFLTSRVETLLARILRRLSRFPVPSDCVFGWKWHRGRRFARGAHVVPSITQREVVRRWMEAIGGSPT